MSEKDLIKKVNQILMNQNKIIQAIDSIAGRMPRRSGVSKTTRKKTAVVERDGDICWLCSEQMKPSEMTLDHVIPRSKGGSSALENLKLAHPWCNHRRASSLEAVTKEALIVGPFTVIVGGENGDGNRRALAEG